MDNGFIRSVFSGESIDFETFEKRLGEKGGFRIVSSDEPDGEKELLQELERVKNEGKISLALAQSRAKNIKAARAMINDSLLFDENGFNDDLLYEQTSRLRSENPWLFEESEPQAKSVSTYLPRGRAEFRDPSRMSDEEYYKTIMKGDIG
ncbi:MAG: phage scaffolding protein [Clostridia bacterium]|nr:phage scaffolding protein [Clostridia bacterium]